MKHKEFVDIVAPPAVASVTTYLVQPGMSEMFPWCAGMANNFQKYQIRNLVAHYEPSCSTSQNGLIGMAFEYNPAETVPSTFAGISQYAGFTQSSVWDNISVPHDSKHPVKNVSNIEDVPGDMNSYHSGRLLFYNEYTGGGVTSATVWGRIFISYEIAFTTPQVSSGFDYASGDIGSAEAETDADETFTTASNASENPEFEVTKDTRNEITNGDVGDFGTNFQFKAGRHLVNATANIRLDTAGDAYLQFGLQKSTDNGTTFTNIPDSQAAMDATVAVGDYFNLASQTLLDVNATDVYRWVIFNKSALTFTYTIFARGMSWLSTYLGSNTVPTQALMNQSVHAVRPTRFHARKKPSEYSSIKLLKGSSTRLECKRR